MVTNDGGNTGIGGALTDTDTVAINLQHQLIRHARTMTAHSRRLPGQDIASTRSAGCDTITFNFRLVDATVRYVGNTVIIDGPAAATRC